VQIRVIRGEVRDNLGCTQQIGVSNEIIAQTTGLTVAEIEEI
jgi:hypothetical protein